MEQPLDSCRVIIVDDDGIFLFLEEMKNINRVTEDVSDLLECFGAAFLNSFNFCFGRASGGVCLIFGRPPSQLAADFL